MIKTKFKYQYLLIFSILLLATGCEDFLDANDDPNKISEEEVEMEVILPTSIYYLADTYFNIAYYTSQYTQQSSSVGNNGPSNQNELSLTSAWVNIYLDGLTSAKTIIDKATEAEAYHYRGIAKVLRVMNIGIATDHWGAIPFDEALMEEENFSPSYNDQSYIYAQIPGLLDDAIADLEMEDNTIYQPGEEDLVYGGDISKWIKLAYTLKARYAIHLTKKGTVDAAQNALDALEHGMESNADDFGLDYSTRTFNPWYAGVVLAGQTGNSNLIVSEQIVEYMDGSSYPYASAELDNDPRLDIIAFNEAEGEPLIGGINGAGKGNANARFAEDSYYTSQTAPIEMVTYAEHKFIEAEARFLLNGGDARSEGSTEEAYQAYLEGIEANMDKVGVSSANANLYLSDASIAVGADNLSLDLIMKEKYLAMFLNPEVWTDMRRYDYNENVYKNLELPVAHNPFLEGRWVRRVRYPDSEYSRNDVNVQEATKDVSTRLWWDQ
ncbi:SusD/RagB family nutrient-binding outer membrane lipoprotein [Salegentibacter mishustinae]|uniref:SusD/RagB family nutrient-binding outer membrane lipoprotein n=1 Tax=Salegentibacter mishustinae TaxID=270918 RepID=UPI0024926AA1|nr:SusD/RagB family nutrient-binding outer membrane lipoprotein [Salegentibacter mishustinae]